jgi:hypothetical protein
MHSDRRGETHLLATEKMPDLMSVQRKATRGNTGRPAAATASEIPAGIPGQ